MRELYAIQMKRFVGLHQKMLDLWLINGLKNNKKRIKSVEKFCANLDFYFRLRTITAIIPMKANAGIAINHSNPGMKPPPPNS